MTSTAERTEPAASAAVRSRRPDGDDPWSVPEPTAKGRGHWSSAVRAGGAWTLGAIGPVARLVDTGYVAEAGALAALTVAWEVGLRRLPRSRWWTWAILGAVGAIVPALTWSTMGRAPAIVALVGVFLADAALFDRPLARWPARPVGVASLALAPLALAQVSWFRVERKDLVVALLAVTALVLWLYRWRPVAMGRADRRAQRTVEVVASWIGDALLALVAAVVLYVPGLIGRVVDRGRARRVRSSYWIERRATAADDERNARRPFASPDPVRRTRRNALGVVAILVSAAVLFRVIDDRRGSREVSPLAKPATSVPSVPPAGADSSTAVPSTAAPSLQELQMQAQSKPLSTLAAFEGVPFADALQQEQQRLRDQNLVPSDVGGTTVSDFTGTYANVHDGERATLAPTPCAACRTATVWFVGGSAAFGFGQRDDHTIASELVRVAAEDDVSLTVRNFAIPGLTIAEELAKIDDRLRREPSPPDAVVFYDGYNDLSATLLSTMLHGFDADAPAHLDFNDFNRVLEQDLDPATVATPEEMGRFAADKYRKVEDQARSQLDRLGIATVFAFQPDALASPAQYEAATPIWKLPAAYADFADAAFDVASEDLEPGVLDLRHIFDDHPDPVFFDFMHQNEPGARIVAEHLYPAVADQLGVS